MQPKNASQTPLTHPKKPTRAMGLSLKLGLMTAFLISGAAATVTYTAVTVKNLELDGYHIDKAGAQRMLTQKLTKCVMEARLGNLDKLAEITEIEDKFSAVLLGLKLGSQDLGLNPAGTTEITAALEEVSKLWGPFQEELRAMHENWPALALDVDEVAATNVAIFDEANALVTALGEAGVDPKTIACSGRLRAISQRSAKAVLRFIGTGDEDSKQEGLQLLTLQDQLIAGLLEGDQELGLTRISGEVLREQVKQFRGSWGEYRRAAANVLGNADRAMQAVNYIAANNTVLLKTMNAAVQEMSKHSKSKVTGMVERQFYLLAILVAAGSILSFILIRNITRPLKRVIVSIQGIAQGVLSQNPLELKGGDEISELGQIFNRMLGNLNATVARVRAVADGDSSAKFDAQSDADELAGALNDMTSALAAEGLRRAAEERAQAEERARTEQEMAEEQAQRKQEQAVEKLRFEQEQADAKAEMERERAEQERQRATEVERIEREQAEEKAEMQRIAHERELAQAEELASKVELLLSAVAAAKGGDLTHTQEVDGVDAIGQMGEGLRTFMADLCSRVSDIRMSSSSIALAAEDVTRVNSEVESNAVHTSERARSIAESASQVSEHIQSVAAAAEEFDASINEISRSTNSAAIIASEALEIAKKTCTTIEELGTKSTEVEQVISIISRIAEQTNLLALNATIEAARAGESGRGFSVVAGEVKSLAGETELATKEVRDSVAAIQASIGEAQEGILEINEVIARINELQSSVAASVEEQTAVTAEIGRSANQSATASRELQESVDEVASLAGATEEEVATSRKSAVELTKLATALEGMVSHYSVAPTNSEDVNSSPEVGTVAA